MDVSGKAAIVTGSAVGVGRATALALARRGANVVVNYTRSEAEALQTAADIEALGVKALVVRADVSQDDQVRDMVRQALDRFASVDVLVNNAGITRFIDFKDLEALTEDIWDRLLAVNVKGVFFCTKHAVPYMVRGGGGSIVNISSVYGIVGGMDVPPPFLYHAAKGAVRLMTKSDALCYAKDKVRVNSIHPGWLWTPMLENVGKNATEGPEEFHKRILSHVPLGHYGDPVDVAYGVLYLASDESKFSTGTELVIDGGYIAM